MPLKDCFFLVALLKDVITRANHCASSKDEEIRSDDKHYVGEKSTHPPSLLSLMCVNCSSREHLEKNTDAQQNFLFLLDYL